ncbi:hypothetical protein B5S28_g2676 [[Candida] boidinii]|uniref:Unnamed protein product n=1 Tax=Candida boidinii TaxID=5477 RepID=A0ACB5U4N6_CANBO|nr:hypothetical protein B5S28_g2676 [[Candida] boidinii]OWB59859.1 hypothetical protein B5S29_g724 [[Candida] boidinii]OWB70965.1 hypothetical protein B5S31_g646 [[Candida] boidinii]OWB79585.1 hypothetical protein B5S32_g3813 [[Candida] boidinii]GME95146.1 unnamed protein product [[Candida] boidinii]
MAPKIQIKLKDSVTSHREKDERDRSVERDLDTIKTDDFYRERDEKKEGVISKDVESTEVKENTDRGRKREREEIESEPAAKESPNKEADNKKKDNEEEEEEEEEDEITVENDDMMKLMGFGGFGTTKNKKVDGTDCYGTYKPRKTEYRQYMNREKGFNRPLSPTRGDKK